MFGRFLTLTLLLFLPQVVYSDQQAPTLPRQPSQWLDTAPMTWRELKGKVVLLNVWTFGCWNSYRSLPWLVSLRTKFPDLQIIGVHSPEFEWEKNRGKLKQTMSRYKIDYPQLLDDDHSYWKSLRNSYWPSFYLVDKQGRIRSSYAGETHAGDAQARAVEEAIKTLLGEP